MFKKLFKSIENKITESENNVVNRIKGLDAGFEDLYNKVRWVSEHNDSKEKYIMTLQSQQRIIEQLTNALKDKYEHGLFIFSEDGKIPTVIRNGKELTNNLTTSFSIDWTIGEFPNIQFEQVGGTAHDMKE